MIVIGFDADNDDVSQRPNTLLQFVIWIKQINEICGITQLVRALRISVKVLSTLWKLTK